MFTLNQRVKIMPHSDVFMMGETHATVEAVGRRWVTVRGFRSGRKFKFRIDGDCLEPA